MQLVVLDLNMPDMHGIDVLNFVRRQQQYQNLPIVVLTARNDDASRQTAEQAGATMYLTKPIAPQVLAKAVRAAPERRRRSGVPVTSQATKRFSTDFWTIISHSPKTI